jgi:eukaryotic-like serine/threonine-protein kinase
MTPERWQEIREVLVKALEVAPEERSEFLDRACSSDVALRQEVETLLGSSDDVRSNFLQSSMLRVRLASGTKLGEYEVKSLVGAGGMGEVYRARDSRLGRDVAIKVLPSLFSSDTGRLRRFEQEARAAAALNHPNILAVFQMGTHEGVPYLVSELLEGETLREQIERGRIAVGKAIDYGVQIARGLSAAHEKGIVHRDLKPENLFVTKDGRVKILDFGLAKLMQPQSGSEHSSPTLGEGTEAGVVMGTVGYMAPEQVRGQTADHRADIFAFGAILYEMLAGKRAFQKPTSADTMSAILNEDPPGISQVTPNVAPALQRVVHRCLEKIPDQRFQSASDLAFALDASSGSGGSAYAAVAAKAATGAGKRWKIMVPAIVAVLASSIGGYFVYFRHKPKLTDKDTIVLADFANSTGDAIFDDTLKTALTISLRQSPFLNVLSDGRVAQTLKLMAHPASMRLTPEVARELCQRAGSKAYIGGAIGSLGNEYVLGLKAVNCQSGDILAEEQVTAKSKGEVLDALGKAASKLRGELGESLATVQRFDVPLVQATTSSLEALKAYGLGIKAHNEKGPAAALPYDLRAIEFDPTFAVGYAAMGNDYSNLGEMGRASEYYTKAFQLREHASQQEGLHISAFYYQTVTGELDKAAESYQALIESYPRATASYDNLGLVLAGQGQFAKAAEITRQGMRLAPYDQAAWHANLANYTLALQRLDEARQIIDEAQARKLDIFVMHNALYALAFLGGDPAAMAQQQQWFAGKPEENFGLALASDTEAYGGRLAKARELTKRTVDSAIRADSKESGAIAKAIAAQREAIFGNAAKARQITAEALQLAPTSQAVESEAGLAFAMAGDAARAESLAQDLGKRFPLDTQMQSLWLPAIRAQLALDRKNPALALNTLQVTSPLALASIPFVNNISCLYPTYIRGEAYLAARQASAAAAEFQKIIDHSGIVWNCWTGALAHLGVARADALQVRTSQGADADAARARSLAAYNDFLTLWKDADPDVPILKQAKAEYAKLR